MSLVPPDLREKEAETQKDHGLCKVGGIIGCGPQVSEGPDSQHSALGIPLFLYPCFCGGGGGESREPSPESELVLVS